MRMMLVLVMAFLLAGCPGQRPKEIPPAPLIIKVPVATYVPIDESLRKRCPWTREARNSDVFPVSNGRKRCLEQYEAQFDGIDRVQGKPVPDEQP
jgi:hypothetical protein